MRHYLWFGIVFVLLLSFVHANQAPTTPSLVYPVGGETVYNDNVTISWNPSSDPDNDHVMYDIDYSDSSGNVWTSIADDFGNTKTFADGTTQKALSFDSSATMSQVVTYSLPKNVVFTSGKFDISGSALAEVDLDNKFLRNQIITKFPIKSEVDVWINMSGKKKTEIFKGIQFSIARDATTGTVPEIRVCESVDYTDSSCTTLLQDWTFATCADDNDCDPEITEDGVTSAAQVFPLNFQTSTNMLYLQIRNANSEYFVDTNTGKNTYGFKIGFAPNDPRDIGDSRVKLLFKDAYINTFPSNIVFDVNDDGSVDGQFNGELNSGNSPKTMDLTGGFSSALGSCKSDSSGNCAIPVRVTPQTPGVVTINNNNLQFDATSFNWLTNAVNAGQHKIRVRATDGNLNSNYAQSGFFTLTTDCLDHVRDDCTISSDYTFVKKTYNLKRGPKIIGDNIVVDCNGASFLGDNSGPGFRSENKQGVTLKNCDVRKYSAGFTITGTSDSSFTDNVLKSNDFGMYVEGDVRVKIQRNNISQSKQHGINGLSFTSLNLSDNVFDNNAKWGVNIEQIGDSEIYTNTFTSNKDGGMRIAGLGSGFDPRENNNIFNANIMDSNGQGLLVEASANNIVLNNHFKSNNVGIYLKDVNGVTGGNLSNNYVYDNSFENNVNEQVVDQIANTYSAGGEGNFWSDHNCVDIEPPFGICDNAYLIDSDSFDDYPLANSQGLNGDPLPILAKIPNRIAFETKKMSLILQADSVDKSSLNYMVSDPRFKQDQNKKNVFYFTAKRGEAGDSDVAATITDIEGNSYTRAFRLCVRPFTGQLGSLKICQ